MVNFCLCQSYGFDCMRLRSLYLSKVEPTEPGFAIMLRSIFNRFLKNPVLTRRLLQEKRVFLIGKRGCRDLGVSPTKMASVYDL